MAEPNCECLFCGLPGETEEHVLPDWVQKDFGLKGQFINLPNLSNLNYLHTKVPACLKHNHAFGEIENRLKQGTATLDEIYLWAYKVQVGLMMVDSRLRSDIRNPDSQPLVSPELFKADLNEFRELFSIWETKDFRFEPSPLGSVFKLPSLTQIFDFVHSYPGRCIGININGVFIAVLLHDLGHATRANRASHWNPPQFQLPPDIAESGDSSPDQIGRAQIAQRIWLCETAYWAMRLELPREAISTPTSYSVPGWLDRPSIRPENEREFRRFCVSFGLMLVHSGSDVNYYELLSPSISSIAELNERLDA